jgi:geranylgeranyl pyrophosphate synthase
MNDTVKQQYLNELLPWRDAVNRHLNELRPWASSPMLDKVISHAVESGGKRLRSILTLMAGEAFGPRNTSLLDVAAAVELLHIASIVLDDHPSMDNTSERRGKLALHLAFTPYLTLLTAHSLVSLALYLPTQTVISDERCRRIIAEFSCCIGPHGMASGQANDLTGRNDCGRADVIGVATEKTGLLFAAAAYAGAIAGGADEDRALILRECGLHLGIAYQILDDIADVDEDGYNRCVNVAVALGTGVSKEKFRSHMKSARRQAEQAVKSESILNLIDGMNAHV